MSENNPFAGLPEVPAFSLVSETFVDGQPWPAAQLSRIFGIPEGEDRSPHLAWGNVPEEAKSFVVTVYDPDAPTGSGFWHWAVADIPAHVTELPEGAGDENGMGLPEGARQFRNDAGIRSFVGAAPPAGHGQHRYFVTVSAVDVDHIDVDDDASPALPGFILSSHVIGRAFLVATAGRCQVVEATSSFWKASRGVR